MPFAFKTHPFFIFFFTILTVLDVQNLRATNHLDEEPAQQSSQLMQARYKIIFDWIIPAVLGDTFAETLQKNSRDESPSTYGKFLEPMTRPENIEQLLQQKEIYYFDGNDIKQGSQILLSMRTQTTTKLEPEPAKTKSLLQEIFQESASPSSQDTLTKKFIISCYAYEFFTGSLLSLEWHNSIRKLLCLGADQIAVIGHHAKALFTPDFNPKRRAWVLGELALLSAEEIIQFARDLPHVAPLFIDKMSDLEGMSDLEETVILGALTFLNTKQRVALGIHHGKLFTDKMNFNDQAMVIEALTVWDAKQIKAFANILKAYKDYLFTDKMTGHNQAWALQSLITEGELHTPAVATHYHDDKDVTFTDKITGKGQFTVTMTFLPFPAHQIATLVLTPCIS